MPPLRPLAALATIAATATIALALPSPPPPAATEPTPTPPPADACAHHLVERQVFWGDLHVHTALSLDASTQSTRTRPAQAYAFAAGQPLPIQPFDEAGQGLRTLQLDRPLDFAAVTDHAELLGEVALCSDPTAEGYRSLGCRLYRNHPRAAFFWMNYAASVGRPLSFCGPDRARCVAAGFAPWREIRDAARDWNRAHDCSFTAFVGYEWTGARDGSSLHRNVIFANDAVPERPVDFYSAPTAPALWDQLEAACGPDQGCDFLVIPHNANLSRGLMFESTRPDGAPLERADAEQRARTEPLVEIIQHKGASECWPGGPDELCGFEPLPYSNFTQKFMGLDRPPSADAGWAREVLKEGLALDAELGANPFVFGLIGSTDTHLGAPGAADEDAFPGHGGAGTPAGGELSAGLPDELEYSPGGLVGVWAEENRRASLFAAMKRRETFATSGPRMQVRLFLGDLEPGLCDAPDRAARAYADGAAMGAVADPPAQARLLVEATRDPESLPLERVQIIKGWLEDGALHEQVYDVAASPGGTTDPATCETRPGGADRLCAVWQDPDYDPSEPAFYYARVLEDPSCRWSQQICVAAGVDCGDRRTHGGDLAGCCAPEHQEIIQERAWSSPVWVRP